MTRNVQRGGKIWVRIFPDKLVMVRPTKTRMGLGKRSPEYWIDVVKQGRILYEMSRRARELMCIRAIGANNFRYTYIGGVIVVVINEVIPNTPLERSEVIRAVIIRNHKELKRDNGMIIRYDDNVAVVIDQEGNPKGTQIFGVIAQELRQLNFTKIISLALKVL
ncbi:hypothetical protein Gotur_003267 [Gossypium turneri]